MTVAILTMFGKLDTTYSLVSVVAEQLRMLLKAGIRVRLLVCEQFDAGSKYGVFLDKRIEWAPVCNTLGGRQIEWHDYDRTEGEVHETFFKEADAVAASLEKALADADVCFLHDILYQGWHLLHNVALRKAQEHLPRLRFLAFSHSAPLERPRKLVWPFSARFTPLPHTTYVSLTYAGVAPLAKQYGVPEGRCRVVYNSFDLIASMENDIQRIAESIDLFSPDVLIVYPGRLTPAKKFDKVAAMAGALSRRNAGNVRVVFCDFPSGDVDPSEYKSLVRLTGTRFGLEPGSLSFTSDLGYPEGFPRGGVLDLFTLSNLFILPSFSEAFPLTALEAASRGNLLIFNEAVPPLEEIGRQMGAVFMRWDALNYGYRTSETYHPSEQAYYDEHAEQVLRMLREDPVLRAKTKVRQRYSPQWVWRNQLEPLLYEG